MSETNINLGELLRICRTKAGLSQEQLGQLIGISKGAISKYEQNQVKNIPRRTRMQLNRIFNVEFFTEAEISLEDIELVTSMPFDCLEMPTNTLMEDTIERPRYKTELPRPKVTVDSILETIDILNAQIKEVGRTELEKITKDNCIVLFTNSLSAEDKEELGMYLTLFTMRHRLPELSRLSQSISRNFDK